MQNCSALTGFLCDMLHNNICQLKLLCNVTIFHSLVPIKHYLQKENHSPDPLAKHCLVVVTHIVVLNSKPPCPSPPGSGHCGGFPGCCSSCGSRVDPGGEVPDEPRCAAVLQQRGHSLHSVPAAG